MRTHSAGMIKGDSAAHTGLPRPGTLVRLVYDTLYEVRGRRVRDVDWVALAEIGGNYSKVSRAIHDLREYYGCDIQKRVLLGEWCGRAYVDYTEAARAEAGRCE